MRNLSEYPVTKKETLDFLNGIAPNYDPTLTGLIGDLRPVIMEVLFKLVLETEEKRINELTF